MNDVFALLKRRMVRSEAMTLADRIMVRETSALTPGLNVDLTRPRHRGIPETLEIENMALMRPIGEPSV